MGMTPKEFFESFVEGNLEDCRENPGSVRRAFNAAISASHLADQWYTFNLRHNPLLVTGFKEIGQFVEYLSKETSGAFRDVRSIANAYKHLYTDVDSLYGKHSVIDSSGAIDLVEIDDSELVRAEKEYGGSSSKVVFTRRDGSTLDFLPVLEKVVAYWRDTIK